jgi:glucosamine-6-phosphate deaminase
MGLAAATDAWTIITGAIAEKGEANIILATGNSQLTFLHSLSKFDGIDWSKVNIFHMDEYLGLPANHPASFPTFLHHHIIDAIQPGAFFPIPGSIENVDQNCRDYEALLRKHPIDLVALGIGESGHLAFNDPPEALFFDPAWVKVVNLPITARTQQVGEGHFPTLEDVPLQAISLTIPALLASKHVLCIVPEGRKAESVRRSLLEPVGEIMPASILRAVRNAKLYLDCDAAAKVYPVPA